MHNQPYSRSSRPSHAPRGPRSTTRGGSSHGARGGSSYGGRSSGGGSRGGSRGGGRGNRFSTAQIDVSKLVNKASVTEEVEDYKPQHHFADFALAEELKNNISAKGYVEPTPIQDKAIPHILSGKDVVGIANTGTGKTAAFLIPLINKTLANRKEKTIVVVPTRELALQIEEELRGFVKGFNMYSVTCVGGASIGNQIRNLRFHNSFIVGTPGRLKDLIERKVLILSDVGNIVLDEADRMLDMGFISDIKYLMSLMPAKRHTLFFSATMSPEIEALIKNFLNDPVKISVKTRDTAKNVDQDVVRVPSRDQKIELLHDMLNKDDFRKVLIFGRTKHGVERLARVLVERGFKAESIHGDKNQSRRQKALNLFKQNHVQILVATDVAARGLDIAGVSHVINYDMPATYEDYIHRIGRTGRGNMKGSAITFIE